MTRARTIIAAVFACGVIVGCASSVIAAEPPSSGDLFDVSRGATVTADSGVNASIVESLLGATGSGPEPTVIFFNDEPAGTVHFVEWSTSAPVTLEGFNVHAVSDLPSSPERRAFNHFRLQAKVGDAFQTLYDADVPVPYEFVGGQFRLVISAPVVPTTAQEFRAEFTQHLQGTFFGPRVVELDGFPDVLCGDANYSGNLTASDALMTLQAGVGAAGCPLCVCDVNGNGSTAATDALSTLQAAVGVLVSLDCTPCFVPGSTTTTTLPVTTTTTTLGVSSTTVSTTTTTIIVIGDVCEIDTATCTADVCQCGVVQGFDYHLGATGRVSGPVLSQFRVNINKKQGGKLVCGGWTLIDGTVAIGCDDIGCCRREAGDPPLANWNVYEAIDLPCYCPSSAPYHNFLLLCLPEGGVPSEEEQRTDPCP